MTAGDNDPILDRLRRIDPARDDDGAEAIVRESVRRRGQADLGDPGRKRRSLRTKLVIAGAGAAAAVGSAIVLFGGGGGLAPGPERALAIEKGPNGVTLTIADADATADEMNRELEQAGIDRVRAISVPGSPTHAGTWGGKIDVAALCEDGTRKIGFGVRYSYHPDNGVPAPAQDFVDLQLPQRGQVAASISLQRGAGKRAIVSKETIGDPDYAPTILIAIHPRSDNEPETAKQFTADDLIEMGGVFAPFGEAMADGEGRCSELGLAPLPDPVFPPPGEWVSIPVAETQAGATRMTEELRAAGIDGRFRLIPVQPEEVGSWLGFARKPPFGPSAEVSGNQLDALTGDPDHPGEPSTKVLALRPEAFTAFPDAHWVFYIGRPPSRGEPPLVMSVDGPENAAVALRTGCKGSGKVSQPNGHKYCTSSVSLQVPDPP